jgi:phosphatidate cytidylyltransferase
MLSQRLLFGALLIIALVGLVYADDRLADWTAAAWPEGPGGPRPPRCEGAAVTAVLVLLVVLGSFELQRLLRQAGLDPLRYWPAALNAILVLVPFLAANAPAGSVGEGQAADYRATVICLTVGIMAATFGIIRRRRIEGAAGDMAATLFMMLYLGVLPQHMVRLRVWGGEGAAWLLLYFLAVVKCCDIGAYFTGLAAGRHKLIEWLSPKKTIEGAVGGMVFAILVAVLVPWLVGTGPGQASPPVALLPPPHKAWLFGLFMAVAGQAGDLLESLLKRAAQAKDSAGAIPAFGGLLDLLDSPLLAAPIAAWMLLQ